MNRGITVTFTDSSESLVFLSDFAIILDANDKVYISLLDFIHESENESVSNATYNKKQFLKLLEEIDQLLFLELFVFDEEAACHSINNYETFNDSDCKIVVLCSDSAYFDLYIKDSKMLNILYDGCKKMSHSVLEKLTDENDERYTFSVL